MELDAPRYPGDLRRFWHPIARSEALSAQPQRFVLLDEELVGFRDDQGVVIFKDLCIHRGSALSLGKLTEDGCLQCPYHGWEYDRNGMCVRIPARPEGASIPPKARAIAYRAAEKYGLVWVALEEPLLPIPPFPANEFDADGWKSFFAFEQTWRSSAGRILENFCDWSHVPFVHDGVLGSSDLPRFEPSPVWENRDETGYAIGYSWEGPDTSEIYGKGRALSVCRDITVFLPFMAHLKKTAANGERTILSMALCPRETAETTLYLLITRDHSFERDDQEFAQLSKEVFEQDHAVVMSQRPEQIPLDLQAELHVKVPDALSLEFRQILQRIGELAPAKK